jgi:hypothetical protein
MRYQASWCWVQSLSVSALEASQPSDELTGRQSGQRCLGLCTFNCDVVEGIRICDGGALIYVAKVTLDCIDLAVHQVDSNVVPSSNTNQTESW